jgi:GTP:adenosylcobinamide-phosphate guanylyltransferase
VSDLARPAAGRPFTALVLAGSRPGKPDRLAEACGIAYKCLIPTGGVTMLVRVVRALTASHDIERIFLSLEDPNLPGTLPALQPDLESGRVIALPSDATPSLSVLRFLDGGHGSLPLLVTTADHPLLSSGIVKRFCDAARASGADVAGAMTPAPVLLASYPEAQRTFIRFRDDRYSGANLFAVLMPEGRRAVEFWRKVEQERKRPWRLVGAFGLWPLTLYLCGRLSLDDAMERASAVMGARVAAVRLPIAEAAIDVDKPADLELVEAILARRAAPSDAPEPRVEPRPERLHVPARPSL